MLVTITFAGAAALTVSVLAVNRHMSPTVSSATPIQNPREQEPHKTAADAARSSTAPPTIQLDPPHDENVAGRLDGFATKSPEEQLSIATAMMGDSNWSTAERRFLINALNEPKLDETCRNNIANGLLNQKVQTQGLLNRFLGMANDPRHTLQWREYCVQFVGREIAKAPDKTAGTTALIDLFHQNAGTSMQGTVVITLARLVQDGALINLGISDDELINAVEDKTQDPISRTAIISMLAELENEKLLPVVRRIAAGNAPPAIVRVCSAAIGLLGDAGDAQLLRQLEQHKDVGVSRAAKGALERIKSREQAAF